MLLRLFCLPLLPVGAVLALELCCLLLVLLALLALQGALLAAAVAVAVVGRQDVGPLAVGAKPCWNPLAVLIAGSGATAAAGLS